MEKIDTPELALRYVKRYGYLNAFETLADAWFEASDTPLEAGENNGEPIDGETAEALIRDGKVVEVSRGHPPGDNITKVTCYKPA